MTPTNKTITVALCLTLFFITLSTTLAFATTENNYKNETNLLPEISESTHTENGYKTNIIINPHIVGIYALENGYKLDLTINPQGIGGSHKENNYKLDLIPEKTFPDIPDVATTEIATSKTVVGQGYSLRISITVSNQALNYETFHVIIYANTTTIKTQTITLTSGNSTTITFTWNTTGFAKGNYTIKAYAWPVPGETDTDDNTLTNGWVIVSMVGDVTGPDGWPDGKCDMIYDIRSVAKLFGVAYPDPKYVANYDINGDGKIDMINDIRTVAKQFGKTDP